jgi:hypothetical protein
MASRVVRPVLAAALVLVALPVFGAGAGAPTGDDLRACATPGQVQVRKDTWARISSPQYAANEGDREVTAFAVPETQRAWVYVTNGSVVQLSTSAGCTWDHIYPAPGQAPDVSSPRARVVTQLVAPEAHALWVASYDDAGGVAHPHVERTPDATPAAGNKTAAAFESVDTGLPSVGRPVQLAVSPVNSTRAYLVIDTLPDVAAGQTTSKRRLYRTIDDSRLSDVKLPSTTWEEVTLPAAVAAPAGLATSPVKSGAIWTWSGSAYAFSNDGGDTWSVKKAPGAVSAIDVDGSGRAAVFTRGGDGAFVTFVDDTGRVESGRAVPVDATSVAHASRYDVFAIAGAAGTYGYDVNHDRWVGIHPSGVPAFSRVAFGSSRTGRILLGQAAGALFRFDLFANESFLQPPKNVIDNGIEVNGGGGLTRPALSIEKREVTVAPTKTVADAVDFGVPPSPVPLDVFFLMDTTTSMGPAIAGLKAGVKQIAENLTERTHGSACFGVGDVKDESVFQAGQSSVLRPYRLVQPITCDLETLTRGVDKLTEAGGNSNQAEAQTIALTQAVTGKGQVEPPTVLPGEDAHFRAPTRVIVLLTDAAFMQGKQGGFTFPTIPETVQTLNAYHDVKVVGVVVHDNNRFQPAFADVTAVVRGTHTFAPESGADCDSDGIADIAPGEPLVCETENTAPAIEPAIVALLLGVKDPGTIASRIDDPHGVVARIDGGTSAIVNLKKENHLDFTLHLTCGVEQDGMDLPVRLVQTVRDDTVVTGEVLVHCRAPVVAPPGTPPRPPPPPDPIPPGRPPIPPPLVAPVFQPPIPNNPISNLNPNAGLSQEEEQQYQVATVGQDATEDDQQEDVELAMSALPSRDDAAAAGLLLGTATFISAATGVAFASRRRSQRAARPAYARAFR